MISARWLFENHKKHLAMAKYYQELLERPGDQTINGIPQASQQILDYEKALQECETYLLYYRILDHLKSEEMQIVFPPSKRKRFDLKEKFGSDSCTMVIAAIVLCMIVNGGTQE